MKHLLLILSLLPVFGFAQICNPAGNVMLFSNYDGGILNIDVNVNIPNLKIGVVTYEGVTINLTGAFVNNVTRVEYAGYNASNAHCGSVINTTINGAPVGATTNITLYPPATLSDPNGNSSIICAYSCDNTSNQGGCNTVAQVENYFLNLFSGSLYAHKVQYGCWSGSSMLSAGGNCCPVVAFSSTGTSSNISCNSLCDGTASVTAMGGTAPYTYSWMPGGMTTATVSGLCTGFYSVLVTDAVGATQTQSFTISEPSAVDVNTSTVGTTISASNIAPNVSYQWVDCDNNFTLIPGETNQSYTATTAGNYAVMVTVNGCSDISSCSFIDFPLSVAPTSSNISCNAACDGSASVAVSGGTSPYTYSWSPGGMTTASVSGLCPGLHAVTVTDALGATEVQSMVITEPSAIDVSTSTVGPTILASNTSLGVTYQWLNCEDNFASLIGETNQSYTATTTGSYAVEVTLNGCSDTSSCVLVDFSSVDELMLGEKELVKIVDFLGRETENKSNTPLIYVFSDGTRVRTMHVEE